MKKTYLTYTNKFKLIFDILFKFEKIEKIVEEKIEFETRELKESFEFKLNTFKNDEISKGIHYGTPENKTFLFSTLEMKHPVEEKCRITTHEFDIQKALYVCPASISEISLEEIKSIAARELAKKFIDDGYLKGEFRNNQIGFYINVLNKK
jgi:hypothetical protein